MQIDLGKAKELFLAVLEMPAPERAAYLDTVCAGDTALRQRIEAMLRTHENSGELLPRPPAEMVADASKTETDATDAFAAPPQGPPTLADLEKAEPDGLSFLAQSDNPGHLGRLGHYEVQEVIGKGGFGIVLKAFDEKLHRVVALKVLAPAYAAIGSARERFIREARTAAAVKNEHVVAIHGVENDAQPPYLVMEMIDGVSLQDKIDKKGPLSVKEILRIGLQTAEGLAAAHKQGIVHRDIKPANILLENGVERVKITDFGLARAVDDASVSQSGTVAGTPMYMSPEQAGGVYVDHRSDLFSLGSVLYVMCTGRPPFRAATTMAVLKRVCEDTPTPIRDINPEIPAWLGDIIRKLHAKKPEERFQTAKEVAEVLGQHLAHLQQPGAAPVSARVVVPAQVPPANLGQMVRGYGWFRAVPEPYRSLLPIGLIGVISWSMVFIPWGVFLFVPTLVMVLVLALLPWLLPKEYKWWVSAGEDVLGQGEIVLGQGFGGPAEPSAAASPPAARPRRRWVAAVAALAGLFLIAAVLAWRFWPATEPTGTVELHWDNPGLYIMLYGDPKHGPHMINAAKRYEGRADVVPLQDDQDPALFLMNPAKLHEELELPPGNYQVRAWFAFRDGQVSDAMQKFAVHAGERTRIALPEWGEIHIAEAAPDDELFVNGKPTAEKRIKGRQVAHVYLLPKGEINWEVKRKGLSVGAGILSLRGGQIYTAYVRPVEPGWVHLFDGKSLAGWKEFGDNRVSKDELTLFPGSAIDTIAKMPRTFRLRMQVKLIAGEGIIRIHAPPRDKHLVDAHEFFEGWTFRFTQDAGGNVNATLNAIHRTGPKGAVNTNIHAGPQANCGEWFFLAIVAKEDVTEVFIDGRPGIPLNGKAPAAGVISLSNVGRRDSKIMFRNIEIKDLAPGKKDDKAKTPEPPADRFSNGLGMKFARIPKGKAWLGGGKDFKEGTTEVNIPQDFYLGVYEVTQEEWQKIMDKNPSHFTRDKVGNLVSDDELKRFPVESVSWEEAKKFVKRVNEKLKKDPQEAGWEYRLPTEQQWEYACRGGPMTDKAESKYDYYYKKPSWTLSEKTARARGIHDARLTRPTKVGSYPANKLGLHDMHGNVWEWCEDQFDPKGRLERVIRGGSWEDDGDFCTAAERRGSLPSVRHDVLGFRLARVPVNAEPKPSH